MRVFISHSSGDRAVVEKTIIPFLRSAGFEPWYSKDDIRAGHDFEKRIRAALAGCQWLLVALTRRAAASDWVKAEVSWFLDERPGQVIPLMLEECDPTELHLKLKLLHYIDLRQDGRTWQSELLHALSSRPAQSPRSADAVEPGRAASQLPASTLEVGPAASPEDRSTPLPPRSPPGEPPTEPAKGPPTRESAAPEKARKEPGAPPRFLVIDDDEDVGELLRRSLERLGYEADVAHDGFSGQRRMASGGYALVFLDIMMPGFDGFAVLAGIEGRFPDQKVIIVTTHIDDETFEKAMTSSIVWGLVNMPLSVSLLERCIEVVVKKGGKFLSAL